MRSPVGHVRHWMVIGIATGTEGIARVTETIATGTEIFIA